MMKRKKNHECTTHNTLIRIYYIVHTYEKSYYYIIYVYKHITIRRVERERKRKKRKNS